MSALRGFDDHLDNYGNPGPVISPGGGSRPRRRCRWLVCPVCGYERPASYAMVMLEHRRYDRTDGVMVPCLGTGMQAVVR
jgi:hypothetical protein